MVQLLLPLFLRQHERIAVPAFGQVVLKKQKGCQIEMP